MHNNSNKEHTLTIAQGEEYLLNTYNRTDFVISHGEGSYIYDTNGKKYLDLLAGISVNNLGSSHKEIVQAAKNQLDKYLHSSNLYWQAPQVELAKLIHDRLGFGKIFFSNSGAEANEAAIKLARKFGESEDNINRFEIITLKHSFHGRTLATLTATGQEKFHKNFQPLINGFKYIEPNNIQDLKNSITDKTVAIMVEFIQGESGINLLSKQFVEAISDICKSNNILLIADEIQTGLGRTGSFFAYEHYNVKPDIITSAKALGGGLPLGATIANEKLYDIFSPGDHGTTFGGNPVSCAAAHAYISHICQDGFFNEVNKKAEYLIAGIESLNSSKIKEIRYKGLMIGIELKDKNPELYSFLLSKGLLANVINDSIIRLLPPLNISYNELDEAIKILKLVV